MRTSASLDGCPYPRPRHSADLSTSAQPAGSQRADRGKEMHRDVGGQGRGRTADLPIFSRTLVPTELPGRVHPTSARGGRSASTQNRSRRRRPETPEGGGGDGGGVAGGGDLRHHPPQPEETRQPPPEHTARR